MPTVFDHLSRQLSGDERRSMLEKISRSSRSDEKPMHSEAPAGGEDIPAIAQKLQIKIAAARQRLSQVYQKFEVEGQGPVKFYDLQKLL